MAKKYFLLFLAGLFVFITACQANPATLPTSTNIPTKQITATETLWPTITAALTATPLPPTPTITPDDILLAYFTNPQIKKIDSFNDLSAWIVWDEKSVSIDNKEVTLTGQPDWNSALVSTSPILENQGIMLTYKTLNNLDSRAEFVLVSGEFQAADFLQFGIYNGPTPKADLYQGANGIGFNYLHGNYTIRKDTWQTIIMAVDDQANFTAIVFDPENPQNKYVYTESLGANWMNNEWHFRVSATEAEIITVNNFQIFSFTNASN